MITTGSEILHTHARIFQEENSLYGKITIGTSRFKEAHKLLDNRVKGLNDKLLALQKQYFEMDKNRPLFHPPEKEGDEPKLKLLEGKTLEQYAAEENTLLNTPMEI